ncbi:MAG: hypothetical protein P4L10_11070 [Acidobacteriaceae bacterium]|nr:hypothetical protein [Acidobacteriaceae bacterium]
MIDTYADTLAEERLENAEAMLAALIKAQAHGEDILNDIQGWYMHGIVAMARGVVDRCKKEFGL